MNPQNVFKCREMPLQSRSSPLSLVDAACLLAVHVEEALRGAVEELRLQQHRILRRGLAGEPVGGESYRNTGWTPKS